MNNKILLTASISLGLLFSAASQAHDKIVTDGSGGFVRDGFGECVTIDGIHHHHGDDMKLCGPAPKKEAKPEPKPEPKPVVHETITLGAHALFGHDKSNLRPEGMAELDALAAKLKSLSSVDNINVVGHTDSQGTDAYNQGLSERRAASVKDYLVKQGISSSLITTSGKGESSPVADNKTQEGRQQNRRVEIMIKGLK